MSVIVLLSPIHFHFFSELSVINLKPLFLNSKGDNIYPLFRKLTKVSKEILQDRH